MSNSESGYRNATSENGDNSEGFVWNNNDGPGTEDQFQFAVPQVDVPIRVGIVGAGYIADFHARSIQSLNGIQLCAVCDSNPRVASAFGAQWGVPSYDSTDAMLAQAQLDVIHILVPPDLHHSIARKALQAGLHVFLEKPMCVSVEECEDLSRLALAQKRLLAVNHNMLFSGAYRRLREHVRSGLLGPLDHVVFDQFAELGQIRAGPFNSWMLREPGNILLEIGPHPISALVDLVGVPEQLSALAEREMALPNGTSVYRRWRLDTKVGRTTAQVNVEVGPGFPRRTITVRGLLGTAVADLDADVCTLDRRTTSGPDFDRYKRSVSQATEVVSQARAALKDYVLSKVGFRKRGNPYQVSMFAGVEAFYNSLRGGAGVDQRVSSVTGGAVIDVCCRGIQSANLPPQPKIARKAVQVPSLRPDVLVLGATGFIGQHLVVQLLNAGHTVRAAARGSNPLLQQLGSERLEIVRTDMSDEDDLDRALEGVSHVAHLATSQSRTWEEYLASDVRPLELLANSCLRHGVRRLVYTGTIDSYYAGATAGIINEDTPLDPAIRRRNYYARAKAQAEQILTDFHRSHGLPVVIFRPGIVIGRFGNPFHWGVGRWASEGVCEVWGDGTNKLPLVLVDDVAAALVRGLECEGVEGRSYNLVDAPLLSRARVLG